MSFPIITAARLQTILIERLREGNIEAAGLWFPNLTLEQAAHLATGRCTIHSTPEGMLVLKDWKEIQDAPTQDSEHEEKAKEPEAELRWVLLQYVSEDALSDAPWVFVGGVGDTIRAYNWEGCGWSNGLPEYILYKGDKPVVLPPVVIQPPRKNVD